MSPDRRPLRAPELLQPRLEVLRSGLNRIKDGDEGGRGTVRRIGKVFLNWAISEELELVERAAFALVGAKDDDLLETGQVLRDALQGILASVAPSPERFVVLAVENTPEDALLLDVALASPDRNVHIVSTGAEAQGILEKEEVALLVLDLMLPDTDGMSFLIHARDEDRFRDLAILIVSGKGSPEIKAECLALGATMFFEKPFDPTAVAAAASTCLHREAKRRLAARSDPLTHLLNRKSIRELWERWTFPDPSSIGILGLDQFQALEERFDHETADQVLASVGLLLRDTLPRGSVSARWEESQFLVLCPGLERTAVMALLKKTLGAIRKLRHKDSAGETFRVTASGGAVEISSGGSFDEAVGEAGAHMEEAMANGGNRLADGAGTEEPRSILVAEDDPLSAGILIHRLEKEGFTVHHYPDGIQALEGALANRIDLAILDVKMPGMDGFELLERLRKVPLLFDLPIIMLTSMGREEDVARGFDLGADDYMVKPFSPVEVLARVRRLLSR